MTNQSAPVASTFWPHVLWNTTAIAYTLLAYSSGIVLLVQANGWLNSLGVVLLTHALVLSAYLAHECMHGTMVTRPWGLGVRQLNVIGGTVMLWLNGGCYARFHELALIHMRHHTDRVDYAIDLPHWLHQFPKPVRRLITALEWLQFPVIDLLLRWRSMTAPFWLAARQMERSRTLLLLLVRGSLFTRLGLLSVKALLL